MQHKKSWLRFFAILSVVIFIGCEAQEVKVTEPEKSSNIPPDSIWVGGVDGGVFVLIKEPVDNVYFGEIYHVSGDLSYKGAMKIFPEGSSLLDFGSKDIYKGWDGDTLYLNGGKYLKIQD